MTRSLFALVAIFISTGASGQWQTTTTNCQFVLGTMQCTSTTPTQPQPTPTIDWNAYNQRQQQINQQNQQNMNQAFQNLGAAIAASRERERQRQEAEALQAQEDTARAQQEAELAAEKTRQDAGMNAMQAAIQRDNTPIPPPPPEKPVLLSCSIGNYSTNLALYEKAGRVDVTEAGVTKARAATFTPSAVSWSGSVWRTAVSRVDMSLISVGVLPEMEGAQVTGTCSLAERKF